MFQYRMAKQKKCKEKKKVRFGWGSRSDEFNLFNDRRDTVPKMTDRMSPSSSVSSLPLDGAETGSGHGRPQTSLWQQVGLSVANTLSNVSSDKHCVSAVACWTHNTKRETTR